MNKKILLVLPKSERGYWGKIRHGKAGLLGLSLPAIAALTPPEWDVKIHDARIAPVDYERDAALVGITAYSSEITSAYEIADNFRLRGIPVVMGGVHVSALPDEALQHADAVVIGEAEYVWKSILEDREAGKLQRIYHSDRYCDMQDMPYPRRDLLPRSMYTSYNTLQATRGCPFDCDYCSVTGVFGKKFRMRPVEQVIEEIRSFDTKEFFFVDDNICGHPQYAKKLFRALIPLKKTWGGQTSITFADDQELLDLYAQSGGRYAFIGIETISPKNLASVNKEWNKADNYETAIRRIHKAGINIVGSFIFGLDDDDASVFPKTLAFIMKNKIAAAQYHILTPLPGTRLYEEMERDKRLIDRDWANYHTSDVVFQPKNMTVRELQDGYHWIFRETYSLGNTMKRIFRGWRGIRYRVAVNISYRNKALKMPKTG